MPAKSPSEQANDIVSFSITINGAPIKDELAVVSIRIESDINRPARAVVEFPADSLADDEKHLCAELAGWVGGAIEIEVGYGSEAKAKLFKGVVRKLRMESAEEAGGAGLAIEASDAMAGLEGLPGYRAFPAQKNSDIFSTVVTSIGAAQSAEATEIEYQQVVQSGLPDLEFLLSRAERSGTYIACEGGTTIAWKRLELAPPAAISLTQGMDIIGFAGHVGAHRWSKVQVNDWSVSEKAAVEKEAPVPEAKGGGTFTVRRAVESAAECAELAKAYAMRIALSMQEGAGICQGTGLLKVGGGVEVHGTGKFDKTYFVSKVVHIVKDGNYLTEFSTGLSPAQLDTFAPPPPQGPVVGVVKGYADPEGLGRVQVTAPGILPDGGTLDWAPVVSPFGKGSMWSPEIGDQVMVCFLGNDLAAPIVVGSLHSKQDRAPLSQERVLNGERLIANSSGQSIHFLPSNTPGVELRGDARHKITIGDDGTGQAPGIILQADGLKVSAKATGLEAALGQQRFLFDGQNALFETIKFQVNASATFALRSGADATIDAPAGIHLNQDALQII